MPQYEKIADFANFMEADFNRKSDHFLTYLLGMLEEYCRNKPKPEVRLAGSGVVTSQRTIPAQIHGQVKTLDCNIARNPNGR
jgi:hypothetical protein